jgi:hypothetical protein
MTQGSPMTTEIDLRIQLEALFVKQTLHELNTAYSRAVDRLDEAAFVALFHVDAIIDSGVLCGEPVYFAREFARWIRRHGRLTSHVITNEWFQIEGANAIGESYVVAIARLRGDPKESDVLTFGRYFDRFEQRDGAWKFVDRRFVLDHSVTLSKSAEPLPESAAPGARHGAFAPDDPIYRFWPKR